MDGAADVPVLTGRSSEQNRLDELLDAARTGHSGALVVRGEPGVGKTSLLDYAASRAGGFRVLRTLGAESESGEDLAAVFERFDRLLDAPIYAPAASMTLASFSSHSNVIRPDRATYPYS